MIKITNEDNMYERIKAKKDLFKIIDRIEDLKHPLMILNDNEVLELENLYVKQMQLWSKWKD